MDSNVYALQNTLNRFSAPANFPLVAADGAWGPQTQGALYSALAWAGRGGCTSSACVSDDDAATAAGTLAQLPGAGSASGLNTFLSGIANQMGLATVKPAASTSAGTVASNAANQFLPLTTPGWAANALDSWKALPTWQKLGAGIVAGFGAMWAVKKVKQSRGKAA